MLTSLLPECHNCTITSPHLQQQRYVNWMEYVASSPTHNSSPGFPLGKSWPLPDLPYNIILSLSREVVLRLHTEPLLVSLPTPDFSMPYNVICFVCTVIAIGFGSIFNLTTRTLEPKSKQKPGLLARLIGRFRRKKEKTS